MTVKTKIALGALTSLALASTAFAQATAPAAAPAAAAGGPPIPGVCVFSKEAAVWGSGAGKAVQDRLKQLDAAVKAELTPEAQAIQSEDKTLASLSADQQKARAPALQERYVAFERKGQLRQQELQATAQRQVGGIEQALDPIVNTVYNDRKCSILFERGSAGGPVVYGANPQMDITGAVVAQLNVKMPTVAPFEREHLDQQAAAASAGAPAPRAVQPATTTKKKK